MEMVVY